MSNKKTIHASLHTLLLTEYRHTSMLYLNFYIQCTEVTAFKTIFISSTDFLFNYVATYTTKQQNVVVPNVPTSHMQILKNTEQTCSEIQAMAAHSQRKESQLQLLGTNPNFKTIHNIANTLIKYTTFKINSRIKNQICLYNVHICK
jgi:hypothetical protein